MWLVLHEVMWSSRVSSENDLVWACPSLCDQRVLGNLRLHHVVNKLLRGSGWVLIVHSVQDCFKPLTMPFNLA